MSSVIQLIERGNHVIRLLASIDASLKRIRTTLQDPQKRRAIARDHQWLAQLPSHDRPLAELSSYLQPHMRYLQRHDPTIVRALQSIQASRNLDFSHLLDALEHTGAVRSNIDELIAQLDHLEKHIAKDLGEDLIALKRLLHFEEELISCRDDLTHWHADESRPLSGFAARLQLFFKGGTLAKDVQLHGLGFYDPSFEQQVRAQESIAGFVRLASQELRVRSQIEELDNAIAQIKADYDEQGRWATADHLGHFLKVEVKKLIRSFGKDHNNVAFAKTLQDTLPQGEQPEVWLNVLQTERDRLAQLFSPEQRASTLFGAVQVLQKSFDLRIRQATAEIEQRAKQLQRTAHQRVLGMESTFLLNRVGVYFDKQWKKRLATLDHQMKIVANRTKKYLHLAEHFISHHHVRAESKAMRTAATALVNAERSLHQGVAQNPTSSFSSVGNLLAGVATAQASSANVIAISQALTQKDTGADPTIEDFALRTGHLIQRLERVYWWLDRLVILRDQDKQLWGALHSSAQTIMESRNVEAAHGR